MRQSEKLRMPKLAKLFVDVLNEVQEKWGPERTKQAQECLQLLLVFPFWAESDLRKYPEPARTMADAAEILCMAAERIVGPKPRSKRLK